MVGVRGFGIVGNCYTDYFIVLYVDVVVCYKVGILIVGKWLSLLIAKRLIFFYEIYKP